MPNKVEELERLIAQIELQIGLIQQDCIHEMRTGGLLFTPHYVTRETKPLEAFSISPHTGQVDYYCHPKKELEMTACNGVFSVADTFVFYAQCIKCNKKEKHYTHEVCFYCLHRLDQEVEQENLNDYFEEHPESATYVSIKECPLCRKKFAWYRWDTEEVFRYVSAT